MLGQLEEIRRLHSVCREYREEIKRGEVLLEKALRLLGMSKEDLGKL